ncbi:hypothetical protein DMJ13_10025 [halophilic archaeon]|nr:hypothetical protein DMJ13_10025 [halophilic archaeon]
MTAERPNVLLVVVDALRADHVAPYRKSTGTPDRGPRDGNVRTPELAAFAEEATTFRKAVSTAPWTLPSVTSLLTGRYPHEHGSNSRQFEVQRGTPLQQELSAAGYHCLHVSPKTWLGDWLPQGRGFDRVAEFSGPRHHHFDEGADVRDLSRGVAGGPEWYATVVRRALAADKPLRSLGNAAAFKLAEATGDAWLDNVRASERAAAVVDDYLDDAPEPFFAYVQLMNPHLPYYVPDEFRTDRRPPGCDSLDDERAFQQEVLDDVWRLRLGERRLDDEEREFLRTRYADSVAYADAVVGRMLDSLAEYGLDEDTLVVVTADHGEHLGEEANGRTLVDHQTSVRLPVLRVPLLARHPAFDGGADDSLVQTNFVAETVRALAGRDYDPARSLLPGDEDERRETALAEYAGVVASHPPDDVPTDGLFRTRRTAIAGDWKLDRVGEEWRVRRVDWDGNGDPEVDPGEMPDAVRERLAAALPDDAFEADDGDVPEDVASNLRDLGYL